MKHNNLGMEIIRSVIFGHTKAIAFIIHLIFEWHEIRVNIDCLEIKTNEIYRMETEFAGEINLIADVTSVKLNFKIWIKAN